MCKRCCMLYRRCCRGIWPTEKARLALATFSKVMTDIVQDGQAVNLPFFKMFPAISGTFDSADAPFSHSDHQVEMNLNLSKELEELLPKVQVHKEDFQPNLPVISEVLDINSGSQNANITAGGAIKIDGSRLKIEGSDPSNGVYFVSEDGGTQSKVVSTLIQNRPGELIVTVPSLTMGDQFTLKITTQYSGGVTLKKPRTGQSTTLLTVI